MDLGVAMTSAVVLVDPSRAAHPEVGASDEAAVTVDQGVLRLDRDVGRPVQQPHDRLPRRLAPRVDQRDHRAQGRSPATPGAGRDPPQLLGGDVATTDRGVGEDDEVERCQVPGEREQRLGRRRQAQPAVRPGRPAAADDGTRAVPDAGAEVLGRTWRRRPACGGVSGSHQPYAAAAVRWVNATAGGSARAQARRWSSDPSSPRGRAPHAARDRAPSGSGLGPAPEFHVRVWFGATGSCRTARLCGHASGHLWTSRRPPRSADHWSPGASDLAQKASN